MFPDQEEKNRRTAFFLEKVLKIFESFISGGPFFGEKPIHVYNSECSPKVVVNSLPGFYEINLQIDLTLFFNDVIPYDQITYQFSHELCHVFINPRVNNWLIESYCECMSLVVLDRLTKATIKLQTGVILSKEYFGKYLAMIIQIYQSKLQLKSRKDILRATIGRKLKHLTSSYDRELNFITAYKIFECSKNTLQIIPFLHYSTANPNVKELYWDSIQPDIIQLENKLKGFLLSSWNDLKIKIFK